jgi:hypothetical protein
MERFFRGWELMVPGVLHACVRLCEWMLAKSVF